MAHIETIANSICFCLISNGKTYSLELDDSGGHYESLKSENEKVEGYVLGYIWDDGYNNVNYYAWLANTVEKKGTRKTKNKIDKRKWADNH